jgi:ABC-type phosphate transport system substrate-binding protein
LAGLPWDSVITVVALAVSLFAFLWEFVFVGRKRLGHRVQMDTTVANLIAPEFSGDLLPELVENDRSYVLVRIENNGRTPIATGDYAVMPDNPVGIVLRFPNRRVTGMALTDLTPPTLDLSLRGSEHKPAEGLGTRNVEDGGRAVGLVELPKVPLNRGEHYKVLVSLESANGDRGPFPAPEVVGGISGGTFRATKNRTGTSARSVALAAFLTAALVGQQVYSLTATDAALDCASGRLVVVGSTAFRPILDRATAAYEKTCPEADFSVELDNSNAGLERLNREGPANADMLAFSDGAKPDGFPQLLPRPVALLLFTLVVHPDAGVGDLTTEQIRDLYAGKIANWRDVGGKDQPVRLVGRNAGSGTRRALEEHVLGSWEQGANSVDCRNPGAGSAGGVVRCERGSTREVLDAVAATPGAIGYSEFGLASAAEGVELVRINGFEATTEGVERKLYPFWETEIAYTYAVPRADALPASFLRYLTNQVGQDVIRASGHRPCAEMENPLLCRPV